MDSRIPRSLPPLKIGQYTARYPIVRLIFSGANVGRAERIMSVAEVMAELTDVREAVIA